MKMKNYVLAIMLSSLFFVSASASNKSKSEDAVYAQLSSSEIQISNTSSVATFESIDSLSGIKYQNNDTIVIKKTGVYFLSANAQAGTKGFAPLGQVTLWLIRDGSVIPNTLATSSVGGSLPQSQLTTQTIVSLQKDDQINVGYSSNKPSLGLIPVPATLTTPANPSVRFSIFKING